jgi:glycosyltransferase involved in cell wall biosynthesis
LKSMKIATITSGFLPVVDGVTVSGFHRLRKLSQWGHQVMHFCPDYSALASIYPNWRNYVGEIFPGIRVVGLPSTPFMDLDFERNVNFQSYQVLVRELDKFQPDLIHVDEPERLCLGFYRVAGVRYARRHQIPCVSFYRTNLLDYMDDYFHLPPPLQSVLKFAAKQLVLFAYNSYDVTLTTSLVTYQKLKQLGIKNVQHANLAGFDITQFNPAQRQQHYLQKTYHFPDLDQYVKVILVSRLTPDKGWDFALKVLPQFISQTNTQVAILIAGDGPLRDQIQTTLSHYTPHVYMLGRVAPEQVPALYANSDVHVTTSEKEARGLTVLEAFASGIPVLAPRSGGVVENIKDGWNGYLYTPQDQHDFMNKLKHLVEDTSLRKTMGERGPETVSQYSWEITVNNLVQVWEEQIKRSQLQEKITV